MIVIKKLIELIIPRIEYAIFVLSIDIPTVLCNYLDSKLARQQGYFKLPTHFSIFHV